MATPDELRRAREATSIFSGLFGYIDERNRRLAEQGRRPVLGGLLSKEPVMGTDTLRYEGVLPLVAGLLEPIARGVDAPRAAAQGLIPQEDMVGEALGTAGTAMIGGGVAAKPSGSLGAFYGREGGSIQDALDLARSGRGIFHSSQADQFEEINKYGVEPQYGPWVKEIAEGATDDPSFLDDMPMAAWWSEQPDWVKMKTARAAGKSVNDVTVDDIRKYGHLSIADADEYADTVYRIPEEGIDYEGSEVSNLSGERMPLYATDLYEYGDDGVGRYPFGIEKNELVTRESVEPKYSLTGQELVDFLEQYDGNTVSANASKSAGLLSVVNKYPEVDIDIYGSADRGYELGKIKVPEGSQGSGVGTQVMNELISAADAEGARISLTPDTSFGGSSVSRLKDFYKRFGFVENKGRNKDFSTRNTMYRDPLMANASKSAGLLSVASDVSARGDQILNMLKSGRGSEVTDAMLGGGVAAKPSGSLGANTLRVYHGGPKKLSASEVEMRPDPEGTPIGFSVTDNPDVAEYYRNMRGGGSISEFDIDLDKANIISERELYEFIDDLENKLDVDASYEQIQKGLLDAGVDAIEYPDPEFGIRVVNPNILSANASKGAGGLAQTMFTDDVYHYMKTPNMEGDVLDTSRSTGRLDRLGPHVGTAKAAEDRYSQFYSIHPEMVDQYLREFNETTGVTLPLRARLDRPFLNKEGQPFQESELLDVMNAYADANNIVDLDVAADKFRKDLTDAGYTNVPYINAIEDRGNVSHIMLTGRTAGDPEVLRSRFAAFEDAYDPSIMAANASPISGLLAQSGVSSEQAQRIEDYLYKTGLLQ